MAIVTVNGTSIQTAGNGAQGNDTLDVRGSGTYAGFTFTKRLNIIAADGAIIEGPNRTVYFKPGSDGSLLKGFGSIRGSTGKSLACVYVERAHDIKVESNVIEDGEQYGLRTYEADRTTLWDSTIRRVGAGVEVHRGGAGSIFGSLGHGNDIGPITKMITDNGTAATNGGDAFQLFDSAAGVLIEDNDITSARAPTVGGSSWKFDGGGVSGYGNCAAATIRLNRFRDCKNIIEMGTDATRGGVPTDWLFEDNEAWGSPDVAPGEAKHTLGLFLRANNRLTVQRNKFHELDAFVIRLSVGGGYAGPMTGNVVRDNDIWVKPGNALVYGKNRAYIVDQAIVPANWGAIDGNRVYFDAAVSPEVASWEGRGPTRDLNIWKSWTGWGTGETWGAVVVPPPPVDPCLTVKAERDAALAQIVAKDTQIAAQAGQITGLQGQVNSLTPKVTRAKVLGSEIETRAVELKNL